MRSAILLVLISISISIQSLTAQRQLLTQGTAFPMNRQDMHLAIFHPSAYALTSSAELSAMLPGLPLYPHLYWKNNWLKTKKFAIASEAGIWYPVPFFRVIQQVPRFESYPPASAIPQTLGYSAKGLFSLGWGESTCPSFTGEEFNRSNTFKGNTSILTLTLGVQSGHVFDSIPFPLIEEGVVFQRSYFLNDGISWMAGLGIDSRLAKMTDITADINYIRLPQNCWAIEQKTGLHLYRKKFFHLFVGYHVSYAQTPNRSVFFATPIVDLQWTFHRDRIQYGLFGKKLF